MKKCAFRAVPRSALCGSRRELSQEYLLAQFGFDTAEKRPVKFARSLLTDRRPAATNLDLSAVTPGRAHVRPRRARAEQAGCT